jgi:hypothetical protein
MKESDKTMRIYSPGAQKYASELNNKMKSSFIEVAVK